MGFLFALIFAAGVGLVWFGAVADVRLTRPTSPARVNALLAAAGLDVSPYTFMAGVAGCGAALGLLAWAIVDVPAVVVAAVIAGICSPLGMGALAPRGQGARARAGVAGRPRAARRRA